MTDRGPPALTDHLKSAPKNPLYIISCFALWGPPALCTARTRPHSKDLHLQLLHGQLLAMLFAALYQDVQCIGIVFALRVLQLLLDGFFQPLLQRLTCPDALWIKKPSDHAAHKARTTIPSPVTPAAGNMFRTTRLQNTTAVADAQREV